jgi:hypothetical protein
MNRQGYPPPPPPRRGTSFSTRHSPYRAALEKLDASLKRNTAGDETAKIQFVRRALFGDAVLNCPGPVEPPE